MNKLESSICGWLIGFAMTTAAFNYSDYRGKKLEESLEKAAPMGQYTEYIDLKNDGTYSVMRVIYNTGDKKEILYAGEYLLGNITKHELDKIPEGPYPRIFRTIPLY